MCHTRDLEASNQQDLPLRFCGPWIFLSGWHVGVPFLELIFCLRTAHKDTKFIPSNHLQQEACFLHWSFKELSSKNLYRVLHQNVWHKFTYARNTDKSFFQNALTWSIWDAKSSAICSIITQQSDDMIVEILGTFSSFLDAVGLLLQHPSSSGNFGHF